LIRRNSEKEKQAYELTESKVMLDELRIKQKEEEKEKNFFKSKNELLEAELNGLKTKLNQAKKQEEIK